MSCALVVLAVFIVGLLIVCLASSTIKEGNAFQVMHLQMDIPGPEPSGPQRPLYYTRWGKPAIEVHPDGQLTSDNPTLVGDRIAPYISWKDDIAYLPNDLDALRAAEARPEPMVYGYGVYSGPDYQAARDPVRNTAYGYPEGSSQ